MNIYDYILIAVLVAAVHRAIGYIRKHKGGCCGDCSQCTQYTLDCKERKNP